MNVATLLLFLQSPPPEGLLLAMALWYALGFLGMLLAWHNYRKRRSSADRNADGQPPRGTAEEKHEP